MRFRGCAMLFTALVCTGCGALKHGPATHVVSKTTRVDNALVGPVGDIATGTAEFEVRTVDEVRLSDAEGREWTETRVVNTEHMSLEQLEAKLFEQAQQGVGRTHSVGKISRLTARTIDQSEERDEFTRLRNFVHCPVAHRLQHASSRTAQARRLDSDRTADCVVRPG